MLLLNSLTPILISRFILNLRSAHQSYEESSDEPFDSRVSVPGFRVLTLASFAGNMGQLLDHRSARPSLSHSVLADDEKDEVNHHNETIVLWIRTSVTLQQRWQVLLQCLW